jgi:Outer membrane protein beta-barrel domain
MLKKLALTALLAAGMASAQEWEIGAMGGFGYSPHLTVSKGSASANTGIRYGGLVGVFAGEDMYNYWSGEVRYQYRFDNLKLSSGNIKAGNFSAHSHLITADFLGHFRPRESRVRPFIAFGGGARIMIGTGIESAGQPLGNLAALTATHEILPVADIGAGFKMDLRKNLRFRVEMRDYISPAPNKVIAPAPGASLGGVMNDIQGMVGFSLTW